MEEKEYQEKYQILRDQLVEGREMTLEKLRKINDDIIKANSEYRQKSMALGSNTFEANSRRPIGRLSDEIYKEQLDNLRKDCDEKENQVIRPGFQQRVEGFINEEFEDAPERVVQLKKDLAEDAELQWLKDPNEKEVDQKLDVWDELDEMSEEEINEGFPGDEEGNSKQQKQVNQNTIELQSKFPGYGTAPNQTSEAKGETIKTAPNFDGTSYPGSGSTYPSETNSPPQKGITHTPPKDGPTME